MTALVLVAGLVAAASGLLDRRLGVQARPRIRAALAAGGLVTGTFYVVTGLGLLSAPVLLQAVRTAPAAQICQDLLGRFEPGGIVTAWVASALLGSALIAAGWRVRRSRRHRATLRVPSYVGMHELRGDFDLVFLPTDVSLAYSIAGPSQQIVVTDGLRARLDEQQLAAVIAHEQAHLRRHHQHWLDAIDLCAGLLWFVPWARRSARAARVSLECWADDDAATVVGRRPLRNALLVAAGAAPAGQGIASLTGADALAQRIVMLDHARPRRAHLAAGITLITLATVVAAAGATGAGPQLGALLSNLCPL